MSVIKDLVQVYGQHECKVHGKVEWPSNYLGEPCPKCIEEGPWDRNPEHGGLMVCTTHVIDVNGNTIGTVNIQLGPGGTVSIPDIPENYEVLKKLGADPKNAPVIHHLYSE